MAEEEPTINYAIRLQRPAAMYSSAIPPLDGGMTFMGWFRFDKNPATTFSILMFAYDAAGSTSPYIQVYSGDGGVNTREIWIDVGPNYNNTSFTPDIDTWFHVAVTAGVSQNAARVYVNGTFLCQAGLNSSIGNLNRLSFGDIPTSGDNGFDGSVKAIKVFEEYLTDEQIVIEMNKVQPQLISDVLSSYTTNGITDLQDNIADNDITLIGTPTTILGPPQFSQTPIHGSPKNLLLMY